MNEIDKAEYTQAINAFLIPSSLFVSCLLGAAGTFLIREGYGLGWALLVASATIIIWAFVVFVNFQNKLRAKGLMKDQFDSPAPGLDDADSAEALTDAADNEAGSDSARQKLGVQ